MHGISVDLVGSGGLDSHRPNQAVQTPPRGSQKTTGLERTLTMLLIGMILLGLITFAGLTAFIRLCEHV